jgi:FixJ family two-component response regulator
MSTEAKIVAVVDDDPEMRTSVARLLSAFGFIAKTFDSAETFLVCASTSNAACLVVDIQLGDISGVELAHQLTAEGFRIPIIFMTGLDDELIRTHAVDAGGIAVLRKPFATEMLIGAIKTAIG